MTQAYPLHWPENWPRTKRRQSARFHTNFATARDGLLDEVRKLGGRYVVLSTNISLRRDGLPYANQPEPIDPGVSIYFEYNKKQMCFACDQWQKVKDNVQAIRLTIQAFRGMERWGASDMMNRAFSAFEALPAPTPESWRDVLECPDCRYLDDAKEQYRRLRKIHHPDCGGTDDGFIRIKQAYEQAVQEFS